MKILLTGLGFAGGHMARQLAQRGNEVLVLTRPGGGRMLNCPKDITVLEKDISAPLDFDYRPELIVHTAAVHPNSRRSPTVEEYLDCNILGTRLLAEWAHARSIRSFVYLSSVSVYGSIAGPELLEATPLNNPDLYGISKYAGEVVLKPFADAFPIACLRLPGVVGEGAHNVWLASVIRKALRHAPISIYNADSLFNNIVHVEELSRLAECIGRSPVSGFTVANVGATMPLSVRRIVQIVIEDCASNSQVSEQSEARSSFYIRTEALQRLAGDALETTEQALRKLIQDLKKEADSPSA